MASEQPAQERCPHGMLQTLPAASGAKCMKCGTRCFDGRHAALEARAEADRQAKERAEKELARLRFELSGAASVHRTEEGREHWKDKHLLRKYHEGMMDLAGRVRADRQRIAELEARLVRCGGENCMGFDASKPNWPVARWVREERLQAAEARIAEMEGERVFYKTESEQRLALLGSESQRLGQLVQAAEAARDALRAFVQKVAIEASPHPGVGGYYWGKLARETLDVLTTPAASQEES